LLAAWLAALAPALKAATDAMSTMLPAPRSSTEVVRFSKSDASRHRGWDRGVPAAVGNGGQERREHAEIAKRTHAQE
jgi:hypothetical protein